MNKKGQALIEFIIVIPIFVMLLLAAFDVVKIIQTKITLETTLEDIILDESTKIDETIKYKKDINEKEVTYRLSKEINITSPFITIVTDNKYLVSVERTLYDK